MGVFLGTYNGSDLGAKDNRVYACFAAHNPFGLTNACSFKSENAANYFIRDTFHPNRRRDMKAIPVETVSDFPDAVEIIKSGYADYTYDMIDCMFEDASDTIH